MSFLLQTDISKRIYGFDILRAMAILFVVYGHGIELIEPYLPHFIDAHWFTFDGVAIFFVLSGYLIGGILLKILSHQPANFETLKNFWIRRWLRTLPNYFLVLLVLIVMHLALDIIPLSVTIPYFFFTQNLFNSLTQFFPESWSLSVEEWFYLFVPIILTFFINILKCSIKRSFLLTISIVIFGVFALRYYTILSNDFSSAGQMAVHTHQLLLFHLDGIIYGVLGAYLAYYYPKQWQSYAFPSFVLGILFLTIIKFIPHLYHEYFFSLHYLSSIHIYLGTLAILPLLSRVKAQKGYLYQFFTLISLISYSMYLLNLSVVRFGMIPLTLQLLPSSLAPSVIQFLELFLYWFYTISGSIVLYLFLEKPILNWRDRYYRSKKKP